MNCISQRAVTTTIISCVAVIYLVFSPFSRADQHYFTSDINSGYGHTIARLLAQSLYNGAYRTVGNIHLQESREKNGDNRLVMYINGTQRIQYPYSLSRRSTLLPELKVAENFIRLLVNEKKAISTRK